MASRLLSVSRAASYLGTSVFHTGFVSVVKDLKYLDFHEWVKVVGNSATVCIIDHAQDHLGDVVYVELPEVGAPMSQARSFIGVESVKSTSDINSPISGKVVEVNEEHNDSPVLANKNMASLAWLTQEMQPPTSQAPVSGLPIGVPSSCGPSTLTAAASAPGAGTPGLMQGPAQTRYANAPGFVIPAPSFSYGVLPNAPTPSGSLQQSASSSVSINLFVCQDF